MFLSLQKCSNFLGGRFLVREFFDFLGASHPISPPSPRHCIPRHLGPTDLGKVCRKMMESCRENDKMDGENDFDVPNGNLDDVPAMEITFIQSS